MNRNVILAIISVVTLIFVSCGNESDGPSYSNASLRDGIYTGSKLQVMIDGVETTVKAVEVDSEFNMSRQDFDSIITIKGFPNTSKKVVFETISDLSGFMGNTTINGKAYSYIGEFTASPYDHRDKQGLILSFVTN